MIVDDDLAVDRDAARHIQLRRGPLDADADVAAARDAEPFGVIAHEEELVDIVNARVIAVRDAARVQIFLVGFPASPNLLDPIP